MYEMPTKNRDHNKIQMIERLKILYAAGFRYVARDMSSNYLNCYSLKPKKYITDGYWGYKDSDINNEKTLTAEIFKCTATPHINFNNRHPKLIKEFIEEEMEE